ncbi:phycobilisome linker polypeptide [Leptolyngbya cf. ectocarpi LEGE 11479]|uniref:Phycobilisome linker polypeptide n=1 Tax=Leptolyngbya cf. ectocarpi LEGE 11479 TaxID=1828722 RepID=A0A928X3R1_LEPEC|nr:phycobilisome linker polypeptide [Leptolyngbya ectocarpi]MBE9067325.1 phycobilisome linker polypeptide [Leptolyngbya cf. ectocarpi LEGE 11479]
MLGSYATSASSSSDSRMFVYELTGLSENEVTANHQSPIRKSHSQFIQVPFHRMSEEMQRITMLGGTIVNIRPLDSSSEEVTAED